MEAGPLGRATPSEFGRESPERSSAGRAGFEPGPGPVPATGDPRPVGGRASRRSYAELLVERSAWLPPIDRALVEAVFGEGLSVAAYVRRSVDRGTPVVPAAGDPDAVGAESLCRSARRRLQRIVQRLTSDRFAFVVARRNTWSATRRRVAMACGVHGLSLREAARHLGVSLHTVRRHMQAVDALALEWDAERVAARSRLNSARTDSTEVRSIQRGQRS